MKHLALFSLFFAAAGALAYDENYSYPGYRTTEEQARIDRNAAENLRQEEEDTYTDTRVYDQDKYDDDRNLSGGGSGASAPEYLDKDLD